MAFYEKWFGKGRLSAQARAAELRGDLTKAAERADRAADKFATTLRITPQSRYDATKAARDSNKAQSQRPW